MESKYNHSIDTLKSIYPNIYLQNTLHSKNGDEIDPLIIWYHSVSIVANIFSSVPINKPKLYLNNRPIPNAGANYSGEGKIVIYAGITHLFKCLGEISEYLLEIIGPGKGIDLDGIGRLEFPVECQNELNKLSIDYLASKNDIWLVFHNQNYKVTNDEIYDFLISIIILHEVGHLENKYTENWDRMVEQTKKHLENFLLKTDWIIVDYKPNSKIINNWSKEATADQLALSILWNSPMTQDQRGLINLSFAITFGMLELYERLSPSEEYSSHPPARMRRDIFNYIRAKSLKMDQNEYWFLQNGAGLICGCLFDKYINKKFQ